MTTQPDATVDDINIPNAETDFEWEDLSFTNGVMITAYKGTRKNVHIPDTLGGKPVIYIGNIIGKGAWGEIYKVFVGKNLQSVRLPNQLELIGQDTFTGNQLTNLIIPNSVSSIGQSAFKDNQLTSLTLPNSIKEIGYLSFANNRLTNIHFPDSLERIGDSAFTGNQLTSAELPPQLIIQDNSKVFDPGVTITYRPAPPTPPHPNAHIDDLQYPNAESDFEWENDQYSYSVIITAYKGTRKNVHIPETLGGRPVRYIGKFYRGFEADLVQSQVFTNKNLTSVRLPSQLWFIGNRTFAGNQLSNLNIPESVTHIGRGAFDGNQLTAITLPTNVQDVGPYAFANNRLSSLSIPNRYFSIGVSAFIGNQLASVQLNAEITEAYNNGTIDRENISKAFDPGVTITYYP